MADYIRTAEDDLRAGIAVLESILRLIEVGCFDGRRLYWSSAHLRNAIVDNGGRRFTQHIICAQMDKFVSRQPHDNDPHRNMPSMWGYVSGSIKAAAAEMAAERERMQELLAARSRPPTLIANLPDLESLRR